MAITQASLAEEILSRSERAVIRGIYRASQLNDSLGLIVKIKENLGLSERSFNGTSVNPVASQVLAIETYLKSAIGSALVATKVPAHTRVDDTSQSQKQTE